MEATGVALDLEALGRPRPRVRGELARLEAEIYADVGHEFTSGSPKQLEQVLFYELNLPKGKRTKTGYSTDATVLEELRRGPPGGRQAPRLAPLREAPQHLRHGPAGPARRRRPPPHDLPPGGGRDRAALVVGPEPPEHPDPDRRSGAGSGGRSWPARRTSRSWPPTTARSSCASWPTSRATQHLARGLRRREGHPPRHRGARPPQGPRRRHARRALDGQDGQLRDRLRDERLRALEPGQHPARRGAGVHRPLLRDLLGDQLLHAPHQGDGPGPGLRHHAPRAAPRDPGAALDEPQPASRPASGWPSTCRSRARPPTS